MVEVFVDFPRVSPVIARSTVMLVIGQVSVLEKLVPEGCTVSAPVEVMLLAKPMLNTSPINPMF